MNKSIYIVKHIEQNTIEGYVLNKTEFNQWLHQHNKDRLSIGELKEYVTEFELIKIDELK